MRLLGNEVSRKNAFEIYWPLESACHSASTQAQHPSIVVIRIEKIWKSKVNVILFFVLVSCTVALKANGFVSVSIFFLSKQERNLPPTLIFSIIFIQAPFWSSFNHVRATSWPIRAIFDHISSTTKVGGVVESFDDKSTLSLWILNVSYLKKRRGLISK